MGTVSDTVFAAVTAVNEMRDHYNQAVHENDLLRDDIKALKGREPFDRDHYIKQIDELNARLMDSARENAGLQARLCQLDKENERLAQNREAQIAHINDLQNIISRRNGQITALERMEHGANGGVECPWKLDAEKWKHEALIRSGWEYACSTIATERDELKKRVEELERQPIFIRDALYHLSEVEHRINLAKISLEEK